VIANPAIRSPAAGAVDDHNSVNHHGRLAGEKANAAEGIGRPLRLAEPGLRSGSCAIGWRPELEKANSA